MAMRRTNLSYLQVKIAFANASAVYHGRRRAPGRPLGDGRFRPVDLVHIAVHIHEELCVRQIHTCLRHHHSRCKHYGYVAPVRGKRLHTDLELTQPRTRRRHCKTRHPLGPFLGKHREGCPSQCIARRRPVRRDHILSDSLVAHRIRSPIHPLARSLLQRQHCHRSGQRMLYRVGALSSRHAR